MTQEQAVRLYDSGWWKGKSSHDIVMFQLFEERLCMPWGDFQEAVEKALGRPVWTHEFASPDHLKGEFLGDRPAPTFQQIVDIIPADKRIILEL